MHIAKCVFLLLVLCVVDTYAQAECKKFDKHGNPKCCDATAFESCALEGCGGDPLLNTAKNRTDSPADGAAQHKTIIQIANFTHPASWSSGTGRALLVSWGEGTPVEVTLYIKKVKNYPSGLESSNCNISGDRNNDYHIVLVTAKNSAEKNSLTAEITPRLRQATWTYPRLRDLAGQKAYVRVTGWAMLDTQHVGRSVPKRKTHWEIHPVTKFEVCTTTKTDCDAGNGWEPL
jgi:hypothetical protein